MIDDRKIRLSFDPGRRCGWAKWDQAHYSAGIVDGEEAVAILVGHVRTLRLKHVVIENFIGGGNFWPDMRYTLLLVGRLRGACEALGVIPAIHNPEVKDAFLKQAEEFLGKKHTKHASDEVAALAHLFAFEYRLKA